MRRATATLGFLVCLCLFPARADAYFWKWLDDLSGPQYAGWTVEVRVLCQTNNPLQVLQENLVAARDKSGYEERKASAADKPYFEVARRAAEIGLSFADAGLKEIDNNPKADISEFIVHALKWRYASRSLFQLARDVSSARAANVSLLQAPPTLQPPGVAMVRATTEPTKMAGYAAMVGGLTASICSKKALQRHTGYLSVNLGYGHDTKDVDKAYNNNLLTLGASYQTVITPYLSVGVGAGVGFFTSSETASFQKFYIEPFIVDFRPFAMKSNSELAGPWWHVFYIRYRGMIFPRGFEPGRFGGPSPRFPGELVQSIGLHADLEPVMRKLRNKW